MGVNYNRLGTLLNFSRRYATVGEVTCGQCLWTEGHDYLRETATRWVAWHALRGARIWERGYRWSFHLGWNDHRLLSVNPSGWFIGGEDRPGAAGLATVVRAIHFGGAGQGDGTVSEFDWVRGGQPGWRRVSRAGSYGARGAYGSGVYEGWG